jgi:hypothetical protein
VERLFDGKRLRGDRLNPIFALMLVMTLMCIQRAAIGALTEPQVPVKTVATVDVSRMKVVSPLHTPGTPEVIAWVSGN